MIHRGVELVHWAVLVMFLAPFSSIVCGEVNPPVGHTISTGSVRPLSPPVTRPAAIFIRSSAMSAPVSSPVKIRAEVHDQYGLPVKDGTIVHFWAGAGSLSGQDVKTIRGYATTVLKCSVDGPVRLLAASGMVQASASLYFFPVSCMNGPLLISEDYADGPGIGKIYSGLPLAGKGFQISSASDATPSGLKYSLGGLSAGKVQISFSELSPCHGAENILSLVNRNGPESRKPVLSLRRGGGRGSGNDLWLLSCIQGKDRAAGQVSGRDQMNLTVSWDQKKAIGVISDGSGAIVIKTEITLKDSLLPVHELWIFGSDESGVPKNVIIHKVTIWGR